MANVTCYMLHVTLKQSPTMHVDEDDSLKQGAMTQGGSRTHV